MFVRNWVVIVNGLVVVVVEYNDMLLVLDEIGLVWLEDVDVVMYYIMIGVSKLCVNILGDFVE